MFPPIQAAGGALRKARAPQGSSSGYELQNDQNSGITLRVANTTMRAFERFMAVQQGWGDCKLSSEVVSLHQHRFGSGGMPFAVRRVSQANIILETLQLQRKRRFFHKR